MKKLIYLIALNFLLGSTFAQDTEVDVVQLLTFPNPPGQTAPTWSNDPTIVSENYLVGSSLTSYLHINDGINNGGVWSNVTTGYIDPNGTVEINFEVSSLNAIEITNIIFDAAEFTLLPGTWDVRYFRLDYSVNSNDTVNLIDFPYGNLIGSNSNNPNQYNIILPIPIILNPGDVFHLVWSPYDASLLLNSPTLLGFYIKDNTVKIKGIVRTASTIPAVSDLTFTRGCTSAGSLNWTNPDMTNREVVVFAKKTSLIDQGSPSKDPSTYDVPDGDLSNLDGVIPPNLVFENDANAMLVYRGILDESVDLINFVDGITYYFVAFVVDNSTTYSNGRIITGSSASSLADVSDVLLVSQPGVIELSWINPTCVSNVLVVCNEGTTAVTGLPTGPWPGATPVFTSAPFFNGIDATNGRVVFYGPQEKITPNISMLTNGTTYNITIWVEDAGSATWSPGVYLVGHPDNYEVIITQIKSVDEDVVEFITLKEINFFAANYNLSDRTVCRDGLFFTGGGSTPTGPGYFSVIKQNGVVNSIIPAGTFIRVISSSPAGSSLDNEAEDGVVTLLSSGINFDSGGDQVMLFIGAEVGGADIVCGFPGAGAPNTFKSALNYGNPGWIDPSLTIPPDADNSYEPPSVSNLEQPSFLSAWPNFNLKDLNPISGTVAEIHTTISDVTNSDVWAVNNSSSISIVRLKDILFESTDYASGSVILSIPTSPPDDAVDIDISGLTFDDPTNTRYMVVVNVVDAPDDPADRYTCYTYYDPANPLDYSLMDDVVVSVADQAANNDPCGTPTTGSGKVIYLGRDKPSDLQVINIPCGSRLFVNVYAVKGNGYTANLGVPYTEDILVPKVGSTTLYYSQQSLPLNSPNMWNDAADGSGNWLPAINVAPSSDDFTSCIDLNIQTGHTVTINIEVTVGNLTVDGATILTDDKTLTIERNLTVNGALIPNLSTVVMDGLYGSLSGPQLISGSATSVDFYKLKINNTSTGGGTNNDVNVATDISVSYGITFGTDADLIINNTFSATLISDIADNAAFVGNINSGSVSGNFIVQRYLPTISTDAPGGSGQGVGWRYLGPPTQGATYQQINDDFTTTGLTGSDFPNYLSFGHYFPSIQKYNETIEASQQFGFDGDFYLNGDTVNELIAPLIRLRRDIGESIAPGEGVFAFIGPVEATFDFEGELNTGILNVNLSWTSHTGLTLQDGWNLISNPFACPINVTTLATSGNIDGFIYIFDAAGSGQFVAIDRFGFGFVAAGQAFWTKANNATASYFFAEKDKFEFPNVAFYKDDYQFENSLVVNMEMVSNTLFADFTTIRFNNEASFDFDGQEDAYKKYSLLSDVSGLSTTISGFGYDIAVNTIPELSADTQIPVKVNIRQAGEYTLSFEQTGDYIIGSCLSLYDVVEEVSTTVDMNSTYTFYSELRPEDAPARFILTMSPPVSVESTDATCFEGTEGSAVAMGIGAGPFTYSWSDAAGQSLLVETTSSTSTLSDLGTGFYKVVIAGNDTECDEAEKGFFIAQPAALENEISQIDPTCNTSDGSIKVTLDTAATWNIGWINTETGQYGSVENQTDSYTIRNLKGGTWEVTTTSDCGPITYPVFLDDGNLVVSDFTMSADTVYISDGGEATFTNTSENASSYMWWYSDNQEEPDNNVNGQHTFTSPGIYNIILWAENDEGCFDIYDQEIVVMQTTGITELNHEFGIIRSYISYGNGQTTQYVIELEEAKNIQIELMNTSGQILYTARVAVNGETRIDLPVNRLSSGMYMVITLADGTRIDTQKLIVR